MLGKQKPRKEDASKNGLQNMKSDKDIVRRKDSLADADSENAPNLLGEEARGFYQICNIRIYARELTEAERNRNYKIDEARF